MGTKQRINAITIMESGIERKCKLPCFWSLEDKKGKIRVSKSGNKIKKIKQFRFPDRGDRKRGATGKKGVSQAPLVANYMMPSIPESR